MQETNFQSHTPPKTTTTATTTSAAAATAITALRSGH
jgi:hypothetical protein